MSSDRTARRARGVTGIACALLAAILGSGCFRWAPWLTHFPQLDGLVRDRDTGQPIAGALVFVSYYSENLVDGHSHYRTSWSSSEADGSFSIPDSWRVTLPRLTGPSVLVVHPSYGCTFGSGFQRSSPSGPLAVELSVTELDPVESCSALCENCDHVDVFSWRSCDVFRARMCGPSASLLPDGSPRASGARRGAMRVGPWKFFAARDRTWAAGEFFLGVPRGRWDFYGADGSLVRTHTYCSATRAPCPPEP